MSSLSKRRKEGEKLFGPDSDGQEAIFKDGEVIFKEGDRSTSAYVIISGRVELIKQSPHGPVRLALIGPGEVFGEMGVIDISVRSATARAVGNLVVEMVDRKGFVSYLQNEPDMALQVIGSLSDRLRRTNALITSARSREVLMNVPKRASLWDMIAALIAKRRTKNRLLEFRIAPFIGDDEGVQTGFITAALFRESEINVKTLAEPLPIDSNVAPALVLNEAQTAGRQVLAREKADLLLWGEVNHVANVIHIRFVARRNDADLPGGFLVTDSLTLPMSFNPDLGKLLYAVSLAAVTPRSESYRLMMRPLLALALEAVQETDQKPPLELTLTDQASIHMCFGNVAATIGQHLSDANWYRRAAEAYQEASEYLDEDDVPLEWANAQYHLGRVRQVLAEKGRDSEILENAITCFDGALKFYSRDRYPWEWAQLQYRLGNAYYRLDGASGDTERLKASFSAYQSALQVFTQADTPLRWAEVKNALGQVLQVWGDIVRSPELLERAVQSCLEALLIRNREETPIPWAATQNNLGSALFLLGKMTQDSAHLEGAADAFGKTLAIYQAYGYARMAKVTERNMARAEDLLRTRMTRRVAKVDWEDDVSEEHAESEIETAA